MLFNMGSSITLCMLVCAVLSGKVLADSDQDYEPDYNPDYEPGSDPDYGAADGADYNAADGADYNAADGADYNAADGADYNAADGADYNAADGADYNAADGVDYDAADGAEYDAVDGAEYDAADGADYGAVDDAYDDPEVQQNQVLLKYGEHVKDLCDSPKAEMKAKDWSSVEQKGWIPHRNWDGSCTSPEHGFCYGDCVTVYLGDYEDAPKFNAHIGMDLPDPGNCSGQARDTLYPDQKWDFTHSGYCGAGQSGNGPYYNCYMHDVCVWARCTDDDLMAGGHKVQGDLLESGPDGAADTVCGTAYKYAEREWYAAYNLPEPEWVPEEDPEYNPEWKPEEEPDWKLEEEPEYVPQYEPQYPPEDPPEYQPEYPSDDPPEYQPEYQPEYNTDPYASAYRRMLKR